MPLDDPPHQQAEGNGPRGRVVQLGERDAILGGPAERVDLGRRVPHRVPGDVLVTIVVDRVVGLDPGGVDRELVPRAPIVVGVEHEDDLVGGGLIVAARQQPDDAVGVGVEGTDEDVEIAGIVGHPRLRGQRGRRPFAGLGFEEPIDRRGRAPDGVVVPSVQHGGHGRERGPHRRSGRSRRSGHHRLTLEDQQYPQQRRHLDTSAERLLRWTADPRSGLAGGAPRGPALNYWWPVAGCCTPRHR
jgi:hypothetical protein